MEYRRFPMISVAVQMRTMGGREQTLGEDCSNRVVS